MDSKERLVGILASRSVTFLEFILECHMNNYDLFFHDYVITENTFIVDKDVFIERDSVISFCGRKPPEAYLFEPIDNKLIEELNIITHRRNT